MILHLDERTAPSATTRRQFPVVGVGASAGGLESFQKFLGSVPANSGMAYILVQHLSPSHESILPEILAKSTGIPVREITDDCEIGPDHIYVIPENRMLEVTEHSLKLTPREKTGTNMPIDVFFSSLARVHGSLAIGVVLTGTATDGTVGLRDIKENGGITFAEDPRSAAWDGMPKNAIEAGVVDFVLAVEEIPAKLVNISALYAADAHGGDGPEPKTDGNGFEKILSMVRQHSGLDFSNYKRPTVQRRIDRRMAINQMPGHEDYLGFLQENKSELESLFQDLLIKVTSFFRDPEIFGELGNMVFPRILEDPTRDGPVRIWVPACATGEEAYSLAIGLFDALGGLTKGHNMHRTKIQIFATDISKAAIDKARSGIYSAMEVGGVSEKRLEQYFTKTDGGYTLVKPVRETVVFAVHNFLDDPPFGRVDLVSCRNVFIYLDPLLQKKALSKFHYALRENGLLLIGKSETVGTTSDLFAPFSKEGKVYSRRSGPGRILQVPPGPGKNKKVPARTPVHSSRDARTDFRKSAETVLVSRYTPASVIVDGHMDVVHIKGNVTHFLGPTEGRPTQELMKMARKELAFELRTAIHRAAESQETVIKEGIPVEHNGERFSAAIEIVPLTGTVEPHYLVLFRKRSRGNSFLEKTWKKLVRVCSVSEKDGVHRRNAVLEKELEQAREDMRGISEDQGAFSEELQSSNEELQSLNEELETSKEELQSTNEELIVVNRELLEKQEEQGIAMDYLDAVIANLREPFVVLERDFIIRTANAAYYERFGTDRGATEGRPFFEVGDGTWDSPELRTLLREVLPEKKRIVHEEIVIGPPSGTKRSFMFNAREIIRDNRYNKSNVLSIEDTTERKRTEGYKDDIVQLNITNDKMDRYVHVASHDLQEPLRKIMSFSDRLAENGAFADKADRETLQKIASSAERMSGLVQGLLEYSSLSYHTARFEPADLNEILGDVVSDFELLIEEKKTELKIGRLPILEVIPLQMNQLLYNLIGNALKFSREGVPPIVEISAMQLSANEIAEHGSLRPDRAYFEITVADNGMGFSPRYADQIFIIFQRLRRSRGHKGNGIGLSLVKKIVENHNGEIHAVSEEGEGAAFHVILPVEQTD